MRNRGSSLCDMAILVIDIMHGLENQTLESIQILKKRRLPFVIALNKVDRIFEWKSEPNAPIVSALKKQSEATTREFNARMNAIMDELRGVGVNPAPYYDNPDFRKHVSVCPISAMSGEGIADLLFLLIQLNQRFMKTNIEKKNRFRCHILEVRSAEGIGATVSVVLVEGTLRERDVIVVAGLDGPIVCRIRALLLPDAGREIRVRSAIFTKQLTNVSQNIRL
jgi:translation initiation factor 5B